MFGQLQILLAEFREPYKLMIADLLISQSAQFVRPNLSPNQTMKPLRTNSLYQLSFHRLLVEGLGVGGGGRDVSVTGSLVRAGGELELVGSLEAVNGIESESVAHTHDR
jgi:hypothetical protein